MKTFGSQDFDCMQGVTTKAYPLGYVEEEQRRRQSKDGFPFGAGRFWTATASLVLGVSQRIRRRPRSLSRSKIDSANVFITYA